MGDEIETLLREVDRKKSALALREPFAQDALDALHERFWYEGIYNSTAIEGNSLTLEEVRTVLDDDIVIPGKPLSDHMSVVGYRDASLCVQRLVENNVEISEHEIRKLHACLLIDQPEIKGEYRRYNLMVRGHKPPSYEKVPYKMLQLVDTYKQEGQHPLEEIGFFHLRLEKIHPFGDGNGRVGRLIINLMLMQKGYPAIIIRRDDRQRYYECLEAYDGMVGNPQTEPMQRYLAERVNESLDILAAL